MLPKFVAFCALLASITEARNHFKDVMSFIRRKHRVRDRRVTYTLPLALDPFWGYHERDPKTVVSICTHSTAGSDKAKELIPNFEHVDTEYEGLHKGG